MEKLIIVWTGWWWYTAGIYGGRYALSPKIIWAMDGGMITENPVVENFPGFDEPTGGYPIMEKMKNQALKYGATAMADTITEITPINPEDMAEGYKVVTSMNGEMETKALILAIGTEKNKIGTKGEDAFYGKWVSYCATCDGFFYRGKTVTVVGWGDSAFIEALYLSNICEKVYLIHRRQGLKAEPIRIEQLKAKENVEMILDTMIDEIGGEQTVQWIDIDTLWEKKRLDVDGVFIAIGMTPNKMNGLDEFLERDKGGYIKVDNHMATSLPGVFAAGDCSTGNWWFRQLVVACAEGALAAESVFKYLAK